MQKFNVTDSQFSSSSQYEYNSSDLDAMKYAVNYHTNIIKNFEKYLGNKILEVGAGSGNLAEVLLNNVPEIEELVLLEPDQETFKKLRQKFLNVSKVKIYNVFSKDFKGYENYFDSVIYNNVLEHVEDDSKELILITSHIRKGGNVCVYSPASKLLYSNFDYKLGHYRRYSKQDKLKIFKDANLSVKLLRYSDLIGYFLWFAKFKILKSNDKGNYPSQVLFFDRYVHPMNEFIENHVTLPFGKNIIVVGSKE